MGYLNLVLKFLRLGPLALGLIAVAILGAGYFLQVKQNESWAERAAALAAGAPEAVNIAAFDANQHMGLAREVVLSAQPLLDYAYQLTIEKDSGDDHVFMIPLAAADGTSETEVLGIAFLPAEDAKFSNITPQLLMRDMVSFGLLGPVIAYNGELKGMGQWDDLTAESFADEGLVMPANPVVVWPYLEGREVALAPPRPDSWTIFGLLSKLAGAIGIFALFKLAIRSDKGAPRSQADDDASFMERVDQPAVAAPAAMAMDFEQVDETPRRRGFGLRKALIFVVGAAFAVLLGGVIWDTLQNGQAGAPVAVTSSDEIFAQTVADAIVPDADPNRHWTDIDVTPVVEWVTAKAILAASGDIEAIKTLGMVFGGILGGVFVLWWFFAMRRSLTPKTSARIDSMGL